MKKEAGKVMALCDTEEEYAQAMAEFLKKHRNLPWELHVYTNVEDLLSREKDGVELLVISETAFCGEVHEICRGQPVVLSESGIMRWENVFYVNKYQEAEEVLKQLLTIYVEVAQIRFPRLSRNHRATLIGNYSPVHRCMQTSFAMTMSLILAEEHPTLYLNFEHYAGHAGIVPEEHTPDLSDLLYFLDAEKEKFRMRMRTMLRKAGKSDYIPPVKSGMNLLTVTAEEWMELIEKIEELEEYEYVILDLSESMQGLFEILRRCSRVYTLTREDRIAAGKLRRYEHLLSLYEYDDVLKKTKRLCLSHIRGLPEEPELLTKGELADLVRELLSKSEEENAEGTGTEFYQEAGWNIRN